MKRTFGFAYVPVENIAAAFNWMQAEGTCRLAYGDWAVAGYELLTKNLHHKPTNHDFTELDCEIVELMIMLPVMRNLGTDTLYWSDEPSRVSVSPFEAATYGIDMSEYKEFKTMDELARYAVEIIPDEGSFTVTVVADIDADNSSDGQYPQRFEFLITGAGDHHVLEDMSKALNSWGYKLKYIVE